MHITSELEMMKLFYVSVFVTIFGSLSASTVKCKFEKNAVYNYTCIIDTTENVSGGDKLDTSDHMVNKTNEQVKMVSFSRSTVNELPASMFTTFKNIGNEHKVHSRNKMNAIFFFIKSY